MTFHGRVLTVLGFWCRVSGQLGGASGFGGRVEGVLSGVPRSALASGCSVAIPEALTNQMHKGSGFKV